jgi:hypothetical protein
MPTSRRCGPIAAVPSDLHHTDEERLDRQVSSLGLLIAGDLGRGLVFVPGIKVLVAEGVVEGRP